MVGRIVVAFLAAIVAMATPASAWSARGHELIAEIAYARLTPAARAEVDRLIASDAADPSPGCQMTSIETAATWSDCVRSITSYRNQSPWHYDNIPICGSATRESYCPNGNCATAAIERGLRMLHDRRATDQQRRRALARVIHIIGDLHQPLHASNNGDRGGNDVRVDWRAAPVSSPPNNLHSAWDNALVNEALGSDAPRGRSEITALATAHTREWSGGNAQAWASESHLIARSFIYSRLPQPLTCGAAASARVVIDRNYVDASRPIIRTQLARAALRLADALNAALN